MEHQKENRQTDRKELNGIDTEIAAAALKKSNHRKSIRYRLFGGAAAIVVFVTTYMLILPAITMTSNPTCGLEEHSHTDACYTTERVLICGQEESAGHTHSDACYDEEDNLICGLEESAGHTHTEDCYTENKVLTCTIPEHTHTDACYPAEEETITEETAEEVDPTEEELAEDDEIVGYGDTSADLESQSDWEATMKNVELTGDWAKDVLAIADSQLGYTESTTNYVEYGSGKHKGYTRYGAWYGNAYGDWCAMFCSFCLHYAGVPTDTMPESASCPAWINLLNAKGLYHSASGYTPEPGDLIFFDWEGDGVSDHIGLVYELETQADGSVKLWTIEGNSSNCVKYNTYKLSDSDICGYGELPENPDYVDETEETEETFTLTATADDGTVISLTGDASALPYPAEEITVTAVTAQADTQQLVESLAGDEAEELPEYEAYTYDISLWHDGEEIEPTGSVTMTIEGIQVSTGAKAHVFHTETATSQTEEIASQTAEDGSITVQTDGFSQYSVIIVYSGDEFELTAETEDGVIVKVTGPVSALPDDPENITLTAERLEPVSTEEYDEDGNLISITEADSEYATAAALVEAQLGPNVIVDEDGTEQTYDWVHYIYDISLWDGAEEIEPDGTVMLTIQGLPVYAEEESSLFHINDEQTEAEVLPAEYSEDGTITVETDHFSWYSDNLTVYHINDASDWTSANISGKKVMVEADLTISSAITVSEDTTIDLNGHTLTYTGSGSLITVTGGTLTIQDSAASSDTSTAFDSSSLASSSNTGLKAKAGGSGYIYYKTVPTVTGTGVTTDTVEEHTLSGIGRITYSGTGSARAVTVTGGSLDMKGGLIDSFTNHAIQVENSDASMMLEGGYLCGNTGDYGGAIYASSTTLTITGGVIAGNVATNRGGGVYTLKSTVTMSDGYITQNKSESTDWNIRGGGISLTGGSFTMSNGYITGNYAVTGGGGIGLNADYDGNVNSTTITNGFISSNYAQMNEGGGIAVMTPNNLVITGGYITNNTTDCTNGDWGGGGMFVSEGASARAVKVLVTDNSADGFGGGVASCSTGLIYDDSSSKSGGAIFGNTAAVTNPTVAGGLSTKHADTTYGLNNSLFMAAGYQDFFSAHAGSISGTMLSGTDTPGAESWTGSIDGRLAASTDTSDMLTCTYIMGLTANPSADDQAAAVSAACVYVTGNHSAVHGGGIMTNGYFYIGYPKSVTVPKALELTGTKRLLDQTGADVEMEDNEFTFYIKDTNGDLITTGHNAADGTITFTDALPFTTAGTFTYYISESDQVQTAVKDSEGEVLSYETKTGVICDTSVYKLEVTTEAVDVSTSSDQAAGVTRTDIRFQSAVLYVQNEDDTWKTVKTFPAKYFTNSEHKIETMSLTDLDTFTNYQVDNVTITVTKEWADGNPYGISSIDVVLMRNGSTFTGNDNDGNPITTTVTLSSANDWTYIWDKLPAVDTTTHTRYTYTVAEASSPSSYISSVSYVDSSDVEGAHTYWVPVAKGETLSSGTEYAILNSSLDQVLYMTDSTCNSTFWNNGMTIITSILQTDTITISGKSYTNYYAGDVFSSNRIFVYNDGYLVNKKYGSGLKYQLDNWGWGDTWNPLMGTTDLNTALKSPSKYTGSVQLSSTYTTTYWNSNLQKNITTTQRIDAYVILYDQGDKHLSVSKTSGDNLVLYKKVSSLPVSGDTTINAVVTNTPVERVTYKLNLLKTNVWGFNESTGETVAKTALKGAEFELRDSTGTALRFTYDATTGYYSRNDTGSITKLTTDSTGRIRVNNITGGDYTLVETKAPDGYKKAADTEITLDQNTPDRSLSINVQDPVDTGEYELPVTGGTGTTLFTMGGLLMMALALVIGFCPRRRRERRAEH